MEWLQILIFGAGQVHELRKKRYMCRCHWCPALSCLLALRRILNVETGFVKYSWEFKGNIIRHRSWARKTRLVMRWNTQRYLKMANDKNRKTLSWTVKRNACKYDNDCYEKCEGYESEKSRRRINPVCTFPNMIAHTKLIPVGMTIVLDVVQYTGHMTVAVIPKQVVHAFTIQNTSFSDGGIITAWWSIMFGRIINTKMHSLFIKSPDSFSRPAHQRAYGNLHDANSRMIVSFHLMWC